MKLATRLVLAGLSLLACACSGTTVLGQANGGAGGSGGDGFGNQNAGGMSNGSVAGYEGVLTGGGGSGSVGGSSFELAGAWHGIGGGLPGGASSVDPPGGGGIGGYPIVTTADGMRANYHFDETQGAVAVDSISQWQAPIYLAQRIDGVLGKALSFGVPGARVELLPLGTFTNGAISAELWLRPSALPADATAHLLGDGGGGVQSFRLELEGDKVVLLIAGTDGSPATPVVTSHTALDVGRWQLVTATFDGSRGRIYLDGKLDAEAAVITPIGPSANTIYVGALPAADDSGYVDQLSGDVDEVKIWIAALSESEVSSHFTSTP